MNILGFFLFQKMFLLLNGFVICFIIYFDDFLEGEGLDLGWLFLKLRELLVEFVESGKDKVGLLKNFERGAGRRGQRSCKNPKIREGLKIHPIIVG